MKTKDKGKRMHRIFIVTELVFITLIIVGIFIFYPRANINLEGNKVNFKSINANLIILSANPDFSNPRYVDIEENVSFNLKPGRYYWRAANGIIEGFSNKFEIYSDVGLQIIEAGNEYELRNVGDVRVNVTKTQEGRFVGHIILEPEESERIENEGEYVGRQSD